MLAWANREALERTLDEGRMVYWSRSRAGALAQGRHQRTRPARRGAPRRLRRRRRARTRAPRGRRLPHRRTHLLLPRFGGVAGIGSRRGRAQHAGRRRRLPDRRGGNVVRRAVPRRQHRRPRRPVPPRRGDRRADPAGDRRHAPRDRDHRVGRDQRQSQHRGGQPPGRHRDADPRARPDGSDLAERHAAQLDVARARTDHRGAVRDPAGLDRAPRPPAACRRRHRPCQPDLDHPRDRVGRRADRAGPHEEVRALASGRGGGRART